jgi:nucleoside 2-deoxyribosyltransferase
MIVYLAGPLFSLAEQQFNIQLAAALQSVPGQISVILPQERAQELLAQEEGQQLVFEDCIRMVERCDAVVAILDGADADSGTCIELGFAYAQRKPIIGVRTDFRGSEDRGLNLMVARVCTALLVDNVSSIDDLAASVYRALDTFVQNGASEHK